MPEGTSVGGPRSTVQFPGDDWPALIPTGPPNESAQSGSSTGRSGWVYDDNVFQSGAKRKSKGKRVATRESVNPMPLTSQQPHSPASTTKLRAPSVSYRPTQCKTIAYSYSETPVPSQTSHSTSFQPPVPSTQSQGATNGETPGTTSPDRQLPVRAAHDLRCLSDQAFAQQLNRALATIQSRSASQAVGGDPRNLPSSVLRQPRHLGSWVGRPAAS